jgi:hypothetical protein
MNPYQAKRYAIAVRTATTRASKHAAAGDVPRAWRVLTLGLANANARWSSAA